MLSAWARLERTQWLDGRVSDAERQRFGATYRVGPNKRVSLAGPAHLVNAFNACPSGLFRLPNDHIRGTPIPSLLFVSTPPHGGGGAVMMGWHVVVAVASLPRRIWNKLFNLFASAFVRHRVSIEWADARILNPRQIRLNGSIQAGRGLWLQVIGQVGSIEIGDGARLSDLVHIGAVGHLIIGRNVLIGSKVLIIDHSHGHGYSAVPEEILVPPGDRTLASRGNITIGNNVWLADNVIVLAGVTIGDNCIVGAHSLVRSDLPANSVCAGNPARVLSSHALPGTTAEQAAHKT